MNSPGWVGLPTQAIFKYLTAASSGRRTYRAQGGSDRSHASLPRTPRDRSGPITEATRLSARPSQLDRAARRSRTRTGQACPPGQRSASALDGTTGRAKVRLCRPGFAAERHRGGVFPGSDFNDARSEARRVTLDVRVGGGRIDPAHNDIERHGTGPFLDKGQ